MAKLDFVIANVANNKKKGKTNFKLLLTDKPIFTLPKEIDVAVSYNPIELKDSREWYKLDYFSERDFFLDFLGIIDNSAEYDSIKPSEAKNMSYILSCQNSCDELYFQRTTSKFIHAKPYITIGSSCTFVENTANVTINQDPDAIYVKSRDTLYFHDIAKIKSIFIGIEILNKQASELETKQFIASNFIELQEDYSINKIGAHNLKRISMAIEIQKNYDNEQEKAVFSFIKESCTGLQVSNDKFIITNDKELEIFLYGIMQRIYVTPDGREKRIAKAIRSL